ncbi:MAG: MogA/MoaB family molybdenum cofactor biosynthesis protein [Bacteroidales bacterium]
MTKEEFIQNHQLRIKVITLSDRASRGEYEDLSGPEIVNILKEYFKEKAWNTEISLELIPDDQEKLEKKLMELKTGKVDILFTTGGTGVGPRDITPNVVKKILDKEIPGIMENIRIKYGQVTPNALLSRGVAGVTGQTQVYCLPGSVKAVKEYMTEILKTLEHLVFMVQGIDIHHKH